MAPWGLPKPPGASWGPPKAFWRLPDPSGGLLGPPWGLLRPPGASWSSQKDICENTSKKCQDNTSDKCQKPKVFGVRMDIGGGGYDERI